MLDVPSHLLQLLHVDTNIVYDMDMDLFPGLGDPSQMYEPALFIATDWSQYIRDPKDPIIQTEPNVDLFELIESTQSLIPDVDSTSSSELDAETFQALLDDVITDDSAADIVDLLECDLSENLPEIATSEREQSQDKDLPVEVPSKKRARVDDTFREVKRSKLDDLELPYISPVFSDSSQAIMARGS